MTTTQITNIAHLLDLDDYAGDYIDDYDMDAVRSDFVDQLNWDVIDDITILANGDVVAHIDAADDARAFDWKAFVDSHDPAPHFERHDLTGLDINMLVLPAHTHAEILRARDIVSGSELAEVIVWTDRAAPTCSRCHQPTGTVDCPVSLNAGAGQGGALEENSQQHGCGEWLSVAWTHVTSTTPAVLPSAEVVEAAAAELAARRVVELDAMRSRRRASLTEELRDVLASAAEPLTDGETTEELRARISTGTDMDPGVMFDHGQWIAWDYDPATTAEMQLDGICVTELEVRTVDGERTDWEMVASDRRGYGHQPQRYSGGGLGGTRDAAIADARSRYGQTTGLDDADITVEVL